MYAPDPEHPLRRFFEDATIDGFLDRLAADQQQDGGWPIDIVPTVADNGVHACFVLGPEVPEWRDVDRPSIALSARGGKPRR